VPVGIEAELYIAGASVATGYLNKPAETAAAFMDDPFNAGDRMYKTGDKVKFNSDGELIFAGRVDDQFKIRGFRVEPGEIETALAGHTDIRTIVVKPWMNEKTGLKSLAAYFVPANPNYNISSIRKFAQEQLPDYMVPAYYVALDSMPMTPNGKINRKALPAPSGAAGADNDLETVIEPQSPLEMQIRLALSKILNKNNIDGNLNLFSIGIDSLSAIKLMLEIQTQTGAKMPVEKLYESKSINAICEYIQSCHGHEQTWSQVVKLASGGNKPPLFLIHTTPGDILGYINLVPRLDNRPVYGIQSLGLNRPEKAHRDIPAMAAQYIEKITLIDPHGPYYLCGWCYGGYVAYEIAQQLTKCGKKVAFLGLIETYPHLRPSFYNYWQRLAAAGEWGIGNYLNYFIFKLKRRLCRDGNIQQLDFVSERFANANNRQEINNMKLVYGYNMDSTDSYYMDYYDGKISLFMVKEQLFGKIPLQKFGWKNLSREIEIFTYDGDHHDILREPVVPIVAADIVQCIANLDK
jgi:aspartate racemase